MKPIVYTERIRLEGYDDHSLKNLFDTKSEIEITKLLGLTEAELARFQKIHAEGFGAYNHSMFVFRLFDRETDVPLGECGFHSWNKQHHRAEVFYNLKSDEFKQKGLMTEALKAVLDYGFNVLELNRIQGLVADYNTASVKLLKKYGFEFEGTMRGDYWVDGVFEDSDCYSLLRSNWQK